MFSKILCMSSLIAGTAMSMWSPTSYQMNVDNSTYANADMIHTTHLHLDWAVDFNKEHLFAGVTHDLEVLKETNYVVFDSWLLDVIVCEVVGNNTAKQMRDAGA
jgi:leukotriene-A4 hydrolase